jgi:4'-phosphopantetheinyl transferase
VIEPTAAGAPDRWSPPPLLPGVCQVWWASPAVALVPAGQQGLLRLIDAAEREKWARFHRVGDQARYLVAHALARLLLGAHLAWPPAELAFSTECIRCGGTHGKPRLRHPARPLELSISHAGDRVAVAVASAVPVGVDVEQVARQVEIADLRTQVLSAPEQAVLAGLPAQRQREAFFTYWTRKEALLKATGHGLALPLRDVTVTPPGEPPRLLTWESEQPAPGPVQMRDLNPGPGYAGSLAALTADELRVTEFDAGTALAAATAATDRHDQGAVGNQP